MAKYRAKHETGRPHPRKQHTGIFSNTPSESLQQNRATAIQLSTQDITKDLTLREGMAGAATYRHDETVRRK